MGEIGTTHKNNKKAGITLPASSSDAENAEISKNSAISKFDDLLRSMGRHEICTCFFVTSTYLPYAWHTFSYIFFTQTYEFECVQNTFDKCDPSCRKIYFPNARNITNIISEWKLVCENEDKQNVPRLLYIIGSMLGGVMFGHWADQHGRRPCILYSCFIMMISGLISGSSPWFWLYCISEFFVGFSAGGWMVCFMVFIVEYASVEYREVIILSTELQFFTGFCILPAVAYFLPNWRHIQLLTSGLGIVCVAYNWVLPESPRWLLLTGRIEQCVNVLHTSSRNTKVSREKIVSIVYLANKELRKGYFVKTGGIGYIFMIKEMRKKVCLIGFLWFCIFMTAFGLPNYAYAFGGDLYLNVGLKGALTVLGSMIAFPTIKYFKRRIVHAVSLSLASLCIFALPLVTLSTNLAYVQILSSMSTGLMAISNTNLFIFSVELYPTFVRNSAMGFGFFCGQIGALISALTPFAKYSHTTPIILTLASLIIFSAALIFILPESKNSKIADHLEED